MASADIYICMQACLILIQVYIYSNSIYIYVDLPVSYAFNSVDQFLGLALYIYISTPIKMHMQKASLTDQLMIEFKCLDVVARFLNGLGTLAMSPKPSCIELSNCSAHARPIIVRLSFHWS